MDALTRLVFRAQSGDDRALESFVRATYEQVWRLCAALVDRPSADDLAQETFTRTVRTLAGFQGDASARTWLLAAARHVCLDELRSRSRMRRREASHPPAVSPSEPATADLIESTVVADLLGRLTPERRAAFALTQILGLSYEEAAQVCDCPLGTIRSRVARARADLSAALDDTMSEPTDRPTRPSSGEPQS
jgi:RNA polymerase sigma-70 factor, ECF subfamily